ncbi:MAG: hypothetical protein JSS49_09475 [Planctomycetes bacterium]|nr:hypothetical protein [Planctomycetota bacterium]
MEEPAARPDRVAAADHAEKTPAKSNKKDGIPYDAFFENPLEVAANADKVVGGPPASVPGDVPEKMTEKPAAAAGALAWGDYLPAENLQSEIKKIMNRLKASMQNPGTYNGNYKEIEADGAVIAALAAIAIDHSGEISWKANAPLIREFGLGLSKAAVGLGKENYENTKVAYENLDSVFGGTIPADAPKVAPKQPFSEVADRGGLMKRIEKARNHLRDNINTDAKLKSESDSVQHEAMMISTLGKVVSFEDYTSADEEEYKGFVEALISGAKEANAAAKDQSFQKFTDSMNKVNKSCDQCHAQYGNG